MSLNLNVLVRGEDLTLYDLINKSTISNNFNVSFCGPDEDILSFVKENSIHIVIADLHENRAEGLRFLKKMKQFDPLLDVIIISESSDSEDFVCFLKEGAVDYLTKPLAINALLQSFQKIKERRALRKETYRLEKRLDKKYFFHGMVGKSPYMLDIFNLIDIISKNFSIVLVTGETGTGKELVARAIHEASPLRAKKFVVCNCAAIPEHLFESELFGYVKGAFTGADRNKKGLFEEAHGGIILMDEIGEIPVSIQAKLLRVMEHNQFRPLGSSEDREVDVRVIAATSRDLRECMRSGTFREDLFYRLNKVEIDIPPLRQRPEDIPLLVRHLLGQYRRKFSKRIEGLSRRLQKLLLQYHWPGNIRELENVLENSFILAKKEFIDITDLPQYLQKDLPIRGKLPFFNRENLITMEELEKNYIVYLLKLTKHNLRKTAKILNISRTTLYNKLNRYNIHH